MSNYWARISENICKNHYNETHFSARYLFELNFIWSLVDEDERATIYYQQSPSKWIKEENSSREKTRKCSLWIFCWMKICYHHYQGKGFYNLPLHPSKSYLFQHPTQMTAAWIRFKIWLLLLVAPEPFRFAMSETRVAHCWVTLWPGWAFLLLQKEQIHSFTNWRQFILSLFNCKWSVRLWGRSTVRWKLAW